MSTAMAHMTKFTIIIRLLVLIAVSDSQGIKFLSDYDVEDALSYSSFNELIDFMEAQESDFPWFGLPRYFKMSNISEALNNSKAYTFFLPLDRAFARLLPQDVPDPFYLDDELRMNLLLNLIVEGKQELNDIPDEQILLTTLAGKKFIVDNKNGIIKINNSITAIQVPGFRSSLNTNIYLIDKVPFVTSREIQNVLKKNPVRYRGFSRGHDGQRFQLSRKEKGATVINTVPTFAPENDAIYLYSTTRWESLKCSISNCK